MGEVVEEGTRSVPLWPSDTEPVWLGGETVAVSGCESDRGLELTSDADGEPLTPGPDIAPEPADGGKVESDAPAVAVTTGGESVCETRV